jgi:hypothetical protein
MIIFASILATFERTPDHVTQNTFLDKIDPSYTKSLSGGKTLRKYFQRLLKKQLRGGEYLSQHAHDILPPM